MFKWFKIVFLLLGCLVHVTFAQQYTLDEGKTKFEHITTTEGLLHNSIKTTFQDSRGYLWIGTINGLYKYDGYKFTIFNGELGNSKSLFGNTIRIIFEDSRGVLWIGTDKGLCSYNRETDAFDRVFFNTNKAVHFSIETGVSTLYEDSLGTLWVGTVKGLYGLDEFKNQGCRVRKFHAAENENSLPSNYVRTIVQDHNKIIWIGTTEGLARLHINLDNSVSFYRFNHKLLKGVSIIKLMVDHQNSLWSVTSKGLIKMMFMENDMVEVTKEQFPNDQISGLNDQFSTLYQDTNKTLWIGTTNNGLIELDIESGIVKRHRQERGNSYSLKSDNISCISEDSSGVLWIGTIRGGLSKLDLQKKKIDHFKFNRADPLSLSGNVINSIFEDSKRNVWVGTFGKGLNLLSNSNKPEDGFIKFIRDKTNNNLGGNNVHGICEDDYGNLWLGNFNVGLTQIRLQSGNTLQVSTFNDILLDEAIGLNRLTILFKDRRGDIWMGGSSNNGLMRFTPSEEFGETPKISQYKNLPENPNSLTGNHISAIYEDSEGILWVGTYGFGLVKIIRDHNNEPDKYIRIFGDENQLSGLNNNHVFSILEDNQRNILLGTFGGGINKIPKEEKDKLNPKIIHYKTEQGLPSNEIYGILEDKDFNLWISTNNGISKYDVEKNEFFNLNVTDGLQALNFRKGAYLKAKNGKMYFGGVNGVNAFFSDGFAINKFTPKAEITGLKLFNKDVEVDEEFYGSVILNKEISETEEITLNHKQNSFSFEFVAMHFSSPTKNKYKYKLEGLNEDWIETDYTRRFASYSNLNAGMYTFKVKASNNDGLWNNTSKEIRVEILPPPWKTWWAYILYTIFAVFLMWLFRRFILVNEKYQNRIKIEKIEQEKIKELNKMKLEFFTNISHEFKTPLTLILGPLQNLLKVKETDPELKETISIMERNANHLFRLINQVMEFRKVDANELKVNVTKGNLIEFCDDILANFKVLAQEKQINLSFNNELKPEDIEAYYDWDKMEKILNNLISNSIKYTPMEGNITVTISIKPDRIKTDIDTSRQVQLVVEDTGSGIPKNKISKIFGRFYQVDGSNKGNIFGSGVGLALTKKLIDLLKGTIEVTSKIGEGSKFTVKLPLHTKPLEFSNEFVGLDKDSKPKVVISQGETDTLNAVDELPTTNSKDETKKLPLLLIVEDNVDMQQFLKSSLKNEYAILQAYNGEEGVKMALNRVPNIIISDVMMPIKDGIFLCNEIKKNEITNHIPIILLTAKGSMEHRLEGLEVGADAYIPKPFDLRFLKVKAQKLLEQRDFLKEKFSTKGITLDSQKIGINNTSKAFLEKAEKIIEDNIMNSDFSVIDLGDAMAFSKTQLYRKFKSVRGLSANEFIREYRIKKAALLLRETDLNVSEILYDIGFTNRSYFSKCFKETFEISPKEYATKHRATKEEKDV